MAAVRGGSEEIGVKVVESEPGNGLFVEKQVARTPALPWIVAGVVILLLAAGLALTGHRGSPVRGVLPLDARAGTLVFTELTLSESVSLSGGKSTYVDGVVRNAGEAKITGVMVQALFANGQGMPPQVETLPLALIRTREPYVDMQPLSAALLAPGASREFRLIFEDIGSNWDQRPPAIHVVGVSTE